MPRTRTVNIIFCLFWQHGVCYLVEILDFSTLTLLYTHCNKNYLNLCIKKKISRLERECYFLCDHLYIWPKNSHTVLYTVASAPAVTDSVFVSRFRLFLAGVGRNDFTTQKFLFSAIPSYTNIY